MALTDAQIVPFAAQRRHRLVRRGCKRRCLRRCALEFSRAASISVVRCCCDIDKEDTPPSALSDAAGIVADTVAEAVAEAVADHVADAATVLSTVADFDKVDALGGAADAAADAAAALLRRFVKAGPEVLWNEVEERCNRLATRDPLDITLVAEEPALEVNSPRVQRSRRVPESAEKPAFEANSPRNSGRSVRFDLGLNAVHAIVPYAEIYGLHPREFVFDRRFHMVPSADKHGFRGLGDSCDEDSEDEEGDDGEGLVRCGQFEQMSLF